MKKYCIKENHTEGINMTHKMKQQLIYTVQNSQH